MWYTRSGTCFSLVPKTRDGEIRSRVEVACATGAPSSHFFGVRHIDVNGAELAQRGWMCDARPRTRWTAARAVHCSGMGAASRLVVCNAWMKASHAVTPDPETCCPFQVFQVLQTRQRLAMFRRRSHHAVKRPKRHCPKSHCMLFPMVMTCNVQIREAFAWPSSYCVARKKLINRQSQFRPLSAPHV